MGHECALDFQHGASLCPIKTRSLRTILSNKRTCYDESKCESCGQADGEEKMLLCDKCDRGYHIFCLTPVLAAVPRGDWFCPQCATPKRFVEFPKVQKKIIDFFRIQKPVEQHSGSELRKRRRHSGSLTLQKKSRKLVAFTPSKDSARRLDQMASLATALTTSGVTFSDNLTYMAGMASRSSNCSSMEVGGMQVMGKDDRATFDYCKEMSSRGECPPLRVTRDVREGFVVEADSHIKDMTIIAEYVGDVDYMRNRSSDDGNCMMALLFTKDPDGELVICPDRRGNISRFVSGINNHTSEGRKKINLKCVRFSLDGEAHALLVAIRDIPKGERLYYDYNGYQKEYPTEHFV